MQCPKCGSDKVTHSHRRGIEKVLRYFWPRVPYRCKECWTRFWKLESPLAGLGKLAGAILILLLIPAGIWYFFFSGDEDGKTGRLPPVKPIVNKDASRSQPLERKDNDSKAVPGTQNEPAQGTAPDIKEGTVPEEKTEKPELAKADKKDQDTAPASQQTEQPGDVPSVEESAEKKEDKDTAKDVPVSETKKESESAERSAAPVVNEKKLRTLKSVQLQSSDGFTMSVSAGGPVRKYKSFSLSQNPPKIVIDLLGKWEYAGRTTLNAESEIVRRVRIGEHPDKLRLVIDLKGSETLKPTIIESSEGLVVKIKQ
jgi:hypothetical protein